MSAVSARRELTLLVAGEPGQRTGGYRYDACIAEALRALGWSVRVQGMAGRFPLADERARAELQAALATLPSRSRVVIDGLALGGLPDAVRPQARRLDLTALLHHPLADETGVDATTRARLLDSERRALAEVDRIIVTSAFSARRLRDLDMPCGRVHIVEPGVEAPARPRGTAARAPSRKHQQLLCVATLTPRKGYPVLIEALAGMTDRAWRCRCVGSTARDPEHAAAVFAAARTEGLDEHITWLGELDDRTLVTTYDDADVVVVPSLYEGYGMVVLEALAHGLPVIATDGGALADTLPPEAGLLVPAGDAPALRHALVRWCDEPALRGELIRGAQRARRSLRDWMSAGAAFARALDRAGPGGRGGVVRAETAPKVNVRDESVFEHRWLALREPADAAARSDRLTAAARTWLASHVAPHTLVDLGSGAGNNVRFLAPRLPGPQRWRLVDHDRELLAAAQNRLHGLRDEDGECPDISATCHDLSGVDTNLLAGAELVAASALLDLVSRGWLEMLANACAAGGQALLLTLTVDGDWGFVDRADRTVETTTDATVRRLFRAHQGRDKGLGPALGPDAVRHLARILEDTGYQVAREPSPWRLEAGNAAHHPLTERLLASWRDAAIEQSHGDEQLIRHWHDRRLEAVLAGELDIFVGHEDLIALPAGEGAA